MCSDRHVTIQTLFTTFLHALTHKRFRTKTTFSFIINHFCSTDRSIFVPQTGSNDRSGPGMDRKLTAHRFCIENDELIFCKLYSKNKIIYLILLPIITIIKSNIIYMCTSIGVLHDKCTDNVLTASVVLYP